MKHVRVTFSVPAEGELGDKLFAYTRFERSFLIKEALNAYFGIGKPRVPTSSSPPVAVVHREPSITSESSISGGRRVSDFLGDFGDD